MAQFQTHKGTTVTYSVTEKAWGHDLVFLNGNLATSRWWMPTIEALKPLTVSSSNLKGRFIFIELPGCGDSAPLTTELDVHQISQDYIELLNSLSVQKASVIGHSTGGLLACLMMSQSPALFQKALLLDPVAAHGIQFDDSVLEKYEEMKTNKELTAAIIGFTINNCDMNSAFFRQIIVEDTFKSVQNVGSKMIRALRGINVESDIQKIQTPVTILFGEKDVLLPKEDVRQLTDLIPSSRFVEVPGVGHCLNVEDPLKMATLIRDELS